MQNIPTKIGMIAGVVVAGAGAFSQIPGLPPRLQGFAAIVAALAAALSGLYHPAPSQS
jgi:hypothetical protein